MPPSSRWASDAPPKQPAIVLWCRLLRLPNLLTVPGDPIAGFVLARAAGARAPWERAGVAVVVSLLLYAAGLLLNDYFDLTDDRRRRPGRPLPAGQVSPRAVFVVAAMLVLLGLACGEMAGVGAWAVLLAAAVVGYDAGLKRIPLVGPLAMGLCRGLSVVLGAAVAGGLDARGVQMAVGTAAGMSALYIAAVTVIASRETQSTPVGPKRFLPSLVLLLGFTHLAVLRLPDSRPAWLAFVLLALAAVGWAGWYALRLTGTPQPRAVQKTIGRFVMNLLHVQAALAAVVFQPGVWVAAALLAAWPLAAVLARRLPPS